MTEILPQAHLVCPEFRGEEWLICFSTFFPHRESLYSQTCWNTPQKSTLYIWTWWHLPIVTQLSSSRSAWAAQQDPVYEEQSRTGEGRLWKKCLLGKHEDPNWYLSTHVTVCIVMHTCNSSTTCAGTGRHAVSWGLPVSPSCLNDNFMLSERPCLKK